MTEQNVENCAVVCRQKDNRTCKQVLSIPRKVAIILAGKVANQTDDNIGANNNPNVKDQGQNCNADCHKQGNSGCDACARLFPIVPLFHVPIHVWGKDVVFGVTVACLVATAVVVALEHWCVAKVVDGEKCNAHHYRHHAVGADVRLLLWEHCGHANCKEQSNQAVDNVDDDTDNLDFG